MNIICLFKGFVLIIHRGVQTISYRELLVTSKGNSERMPSMPLDVISIWMLR